MYFYATTANVMDAANRSPSTRIANSPPISCVRSVSYTHLQILPRSYPAHTDKDFCDTDEAAPLPSPAYVLSLIHI